VELGDIFSVGIRSGGGWLFSKLEPKSLNRCVLRNLRSVSGVDCSCGESNGQFCDSKQKRQNKAEW